MAKNVLNVDFDEASMARKLKKLAKSYGHSQDQAIKRWGVQTAKELAKYTQVFGSKPKIHKMMLFKDASKVIYSHEGRAKSSKTGRSVSFLANGRRRSASTNDYLRSESEVLRWIEANRTGKNKHTVALPNNQKKVCSNAMLKRAINQKYKLTAGMAKDGWLDAGEQIARGQKGHSPEKIAVSMMKFARKKKNLGRAVQGSRMMKSFGELINKVSYSSVSHVISQSKKKLAVRDGMNKTLKWYEKSIKAENKKKK